MQDPEPSRRAAEPLQSLSPKELIRSLGLKEATQPEGEELSPEAKENRLHAAKEISLIFELRNNRAFEWFEHEFIDKPYWEARRGLMNVAEADRGDLPRIQTTYAALKQVKIGMLEREIAHREQINPNDEQIAILRERLALL